MGDAMLKTTAKIYAGVFEDANSLGKCMEDVFIPANGTMVAKVSKALQDAVVAFLPSMQALALAISVVFFLIALLELTTQERLTLEFFIKFFGKLVISIALIASCETLTKNLMLFGEGFGTMFKSFVPGVSATGTAPTEADLYDIFNASDVHWSQIILSAISVGTPMALATKVLLIITYMVAFSRLIELCARGMFMPIAFALISDDGWRGAGGRYIRKFIAVCAQIAVLIVVAKITTGVMSLSTEEVLSAIQEAADYNSLTEAMSKQMTICVGVGFASTQAMFKSISIISDAFGG